MNTYNDSPYQTFKEATVGALDGKEHHVVELDPTNDDGVRLATGANGSVGVLKQKLQDGPLGTGDVNVRLLGGGGTIKVVAGGAIAKWARVKSAVGGKVVVASTGDRSIGIKKTNGTSADGDVIEIIDIQEQAP
jgi:hypothetical protein